MAHTTDVIALAAQPITADGFAPFGQVIFPSKDGKPFDSADAQLVLDQGTPRFYIMRLTGRGRRFHQITRHRQCTQCLGSLAGKTWFLGVAPPGTAEAPAPDSIRVFEIPGTCFVKLHVGTWHAGPYFDGEAVDFYNLELSDTNLVDHDTCNLRQRYGTEYAIAAGPS
ncbi:MAG: ureidoglycolate lyase [Cyanobacteria bacterium P01_A01_bin.135]